MSPITQTTWSSGARAGLGAGFTVEDLNNFPIMAPRSPLQSRLARRDVRARPWRPGDIRRCADDHAGARSEDLVNPASTDPAHESSTFFMRIILRPY
ncbi:hypothetical protein [Brevundimonas aurantiaca]|uniref:hypothetical protein n=1 Tax=Brevundimonas aurantiaca TaxID=74316 RepID=UPI00174CBFBE|nr:hypothetical protein [Brevundimonas aurantiaca]